MTCLIGIHYLHFQSEASQLLKALEWHVQQVQQVKAALRPGQAGSQCNAPICREDHFQQLTKLLTDTHERDQGGSAYVTGLPGTGGPIFSPACTLTSRNLESIAAFACKLVGVKQLACMHRCLTIKHSCQVRDRLIGRNDPCF